MSARDKKWEYNHCTRHRANKNNWRRFSSKPIRHYRAMENTKWCRPADNNNNCAMLIIMCVGAGKSRETITRPHLSLADRTNSVSNWAPQAFELLTFVARDRDTSIYAMYNIRYGYLYTRCNCSVYYSSIAVVWTAILL